MTLPLAGQRLALRQALRAHSWRGCAGAPMLDRIGNTSRSRLSCYDTCDGLISNRSLQMNKSCRKQANRPRGGSEDRRRAYRHRHIPISVLHTCFAGCRMCCAFRPGFGRRGLLPIHIYRSHGEASSEAVGELWLKLGDAVIRRYSLLVTYLPNANRNVSSGSILAAGSRTRERP